MINVVGNSYNGEITKVWKISSQNNSETITNENNKEIPHERYRKYKKLLII